MSDERRATIVFPGNIATLRSAIEDIDDTAKTIEYLHGKRYHGGVVVVLPDAWRERFERICGEAKALAVELDAMPTYEIVQVTRLKLDAETVLDVEHERGKRAE